MQHIRVCDHRRLIYPGLGHGIGMGLNARKITACHRQRNARTDRKSVGQLGQSKVQRGRFAMYQRHALVEAFAIAAAEGAHKDAGDRAAGLDYAETGNHVGIVDISRDSQIDADVADHAQRLCQRFALVIEHIVAFQQMPLVLRTAAFHVPENLPAACPYRIIGIINEVVVCSRCRRRPRQRPVAALSVGMAV